MEGGCTMSNGFASGCYPLYAAVAGTKARIDIFGGEDMKNNFREMGRRSTATIERGPLK